MNLPNFKLITGSIETFIYIVLCFSFICRTVVTIVNAYRQDVSLWGYIIAGCIIGGVTKINFGMNGILVGSTLGKS